MEATPLDNLVNYYKLDDPTTDIESAYKLIQLVSHEHPRIIVGGLGFYHLLEIEIKKEYYAYLTGVIPSGMTEEDVSHYSVIEAIIFFRQTGREAISLTNAVNRVYFQLQTKGKLSSLGINTMMAMFDKAKEGDEYSKQLVTLFTELRGYVPKSEIE